MKFHGERRARRPWSRLEVFGRAQMRRQVGFIESKLGWGVNTARYNPPHMIPDIYIHLAVALGLGLLVGLQRERTGSTIAGIRTFALITLFGAVAGQFGKTFGGWIVAVGLVCSALLVTMGNLARIGKGEAEPGQTTEFT